MVQIPGQVESLVDVDRKTTPQWYQFFRDLWNSLTGSWKAYTPVLTASGGGAFSVVTPTARYRRVGKTVDIEFNITLTNIGTAAGYPVASLPPNTVAAANAILAGREAASGKMIAGGIGSGATTVLFIYYDSSPPLANGLTITASGTYEVQ